MYRSLVNSIQVHKREGIFKRLEVWIFPLFRMFENTDQQNSIGTSVSMTTLSILFVIGWVLGTWPKQFQVEKKKITTWSSRVDHFVDCAYCFSVRCIGVLYVFLELGLRLCACNNCGVSYSEIMLIRYQGDSHLDKELSAF